MADFKNKIPEDRPTSDADVRRKLDDAAEAARRPHADAEERERRREGAREAERNPRRQGDD